MRSMNDGYGMSILTHGEWEDDESGFDDRREWEMGMAGMESMGLHGNDNGLAWTGTGLHG